MIYPRRGRMKARSRNPLERGLPLEVLTLVFIFVLITVTIIAIIITTQIIIIIAIITLEEVAPRRSKIISTITLVLGRRWKTCHSHLTSTRYHKQ